MIQRLSDIIKNPLTAPASLRASKNQSTATGQNRKSVGNRKLKQREARQQNLAASMQINKSDLTNSCIQPANPRVDCYSSKRIKHRLYTYERIKHKNEQRQSEREQQIKSMAPNAIEKLQRIRRAQASHKTKLNDR